jgi:hypothetical protein
LWVVELSGSTAVVGGSSATVAFDKADTEETFYSIAGGGAISYDIPWSQVDPDVPNQYLTLANFNLNLAGQNIGAGYTYPGSDAPQVHFQNGEFKGLVFDLDTSALAGFPVSRLTMSGLDLDYVFGGQTFQVRADLGSTFVHLDFTGTTVGRDYTLTITIETADGTLPVIGVGITAAATPETIRTTVATALETAKVAVRSAGTTQLIISDADGKPLKSVTISGTGAGYVPPKKVGFRGDIKYNGM